MTRAPSIISNGTGNQSAGTVSARTGDPIDPRWFRGGAVDYWDSGADNYEFTTVQALIARGAPYTFKQEDIDDDTPLLGYGTGRETGTSWGDGGYQYIRLHLSFDPAELNRRIPGTTYPHYTYPGQVLAGRPGGVFIGEYVVARSPATRQYYANYYWGFGAPFTFEYGRQNPDGTSAGAGVTLPTVYLSMAWATHSAGSKDSFGNLYLQDPYIDNGGGSYAMNLEEAVSKYTLGNFAHWVAGVAIPQMPVKNGKYLAINLD